MNLFLMTPSIIKESSEGTTYCPIQNELFNSRRSIEVVGEITRESVYSLILQLRYLHSADPEKEITMYINSPGGSVIDGLALYDVMAAVSCPIRTVCVGMPHPCLSPMGRGFLRLAAPVSLTNKPERLNV